MAEETTTVKTENLTKTYSAYSGEYYALREVNIKVRRGELVSIVGPSGSGKSTLLNLIGALDRPTSGRVHVDNIDTSTLDDEDLAYLRNRKIGFVFQSFNLVARMSSLANVELPLIVRGIPGDERKHLALKMLKAVGLGEKSTRKPTELSGGEQQRVAIARALVGEPALVLGDEITGNLDSKTAFDMFTLIKELNQKMNTTFIFVTHNLELASATDRIIKLRDGAVEAEVIPGNPA